MAERYNDKQKMMKIFFPSLGIEKIIELGNIFKLKTYMDNGEMRTLENEAQLLDETN